MPASNALRAAHRRLKVIRDVLLKEEYVGHEVVTDFHAVLQEIEEMTDEYLYSLRVPATVYMSASRFGLPPLSCPSDQVMRKLSETLAFLREKYGLSDAADRLDVIHAYITDAGLRDQCDDILAGDGDFDRAIVQATLVLEDRIRRKSDLGRRTVGVTLVNKAMNADVSKSIVKLSAAADEHEGFCSIFRGIVQAYRNPSHHQLSKRFTRIDALRFCGFVDCLLRIIDEAEVQSS